MKDEYNRIIRGVGTYGNPIIYGNLTKIYVGKYTSLSDLSTFDAGFQHNTDFISTYPFNQKMEGCEKLNLHPVSRGNITIGNDCWICDNSFIRSGATVGDGAIIAFGAVVTEFVPPYCVFGGVPAKNIRWRYPEEIIQALLKISWWNWDEQKIKENAPLLMSNNIHEFIKKHA